MNDAERRALHALANPERLRILALIADSGLTSTEIADRLGCDGDVIAAHLAILGKAGLVSTERTGHERRVRLDRDRLSALAITTEPEPVVAPDESIPQSVRQFFRDGRLTTLPAKRSRYLELLAYLVLDFQIDRAYPEADINAILLRRHEDFATLRRDLVDFGYMTRASGIYRRLK
jgi:DNA-binding CsgD family transcriptional regulator